MTPMLSSQNVYILFWFYYVLWWLDSNTNRFYPYAYFSVTQIPIKQLYVGEYSP